MATATTPGTYIEETQALTQAVSLDAQQPAQVVMIGYTTVTHPQGAALIGVPTRVTSLAAFEALFGTAAPSLVHCQIDATHGQITSLDITPSPYLLHAAIALFFRHGGDACWVITVGEATTTPPCLSRC